MNTAAYRSLIEEKELILSIRLRQFGFTEQPVHLQVRQFLSKFDEVFSELPAVEEACSFEIGITGTDIKNRSPVVRQRKMDIRMRECRPCHLICDMVHLSRIGFEEFQACGDIVKEVVNRHVGAGGNIRFLAQNGKRHPQRPPLFPQARQRYG